MEIFIVFFSAFFGVLPKKFMPLFNLLLMLVFAWLSSNIAIEVLFYNSIFHYKLPILIWQNAIQLEVDKLSAFFILVVNITIVVSAVYSIFYLKMYQKLSRWQLALHYTAYFSLHWSMVVLTMLQTSIAFLFVWEIMSLSSFVLVMFEAEKQPTRKAAINYFIQMHIAAIFLIIGILISHYYTSSWSFSSMKDYFGQYNNILLFFVFFAGFGFKAGFMPFHTWLPHAHPAAPSHISAIMSAVMLKMGIYGILRIVFMLQNNLFTIGLIVIFVAMITSISGISMAIVQNNLKRLLAFSSIENIGIIGLGIGVGILGMSYKSNIVTLLGFSGALLHVLNHSLFKSLLFFSAGSVYARTHNLNLDSLGGLIKKMPFTATFFLIAAIAICGLPPFNGFISEFLIYNSLVKSLIEGDFVLKLVALFSIIGLSVVGGLAVFSFTRAFGIAFLGNPRNINVQQTKEVDWYAIAIQIFSVLLIMLIGFVPILLIKPIESIVNSFVPNKILLPSSYYTTFEKISLVIGVFVFLIVILFIIKKLNQKNKTIVYEPTWGCAYNGTAPKTQYTASSFSENFSFDMEHLVGLEEKKTKIAENEYFPKHKEFEIHHFSPFEKRFFSATSRLFKRFFDKIAIIQTGRIQHYVFFPFVIIIVLIILSILNII